MNSDSIADGMLTTLLKTTVLISTAGAALISTSCASAPASTRFDRSHPWLATPPAAESQASSGNTFDESFGLEPTQGDEQAEEALMPESHGSSGGPESQPSVSGQHDHHHGDKQ